MRVVVQRVTEARVTVESEEIGAIGQGVMLLVGIAPGDSESTARTLAEKIVNLRIFEDEAGKMNRSVLDIAGEALVVSQFTLFADLSRGRRPSFNGAAPPDLAAPLIAQFADALSTHGVRVAQGRFGAYMHVSLVNDGPVTIIIDS